jgi:hypothetical protein
MLAPSKVLRSLQGRLNAGEQIVFGDGLVQNANHSSLQCLRTNALARERGDDDRRNSPAGSRQLAYQLKTGYPGQFDVGNQTRCLLKQIGLQELLSRRKYFGSEAKRLQKSGYCVTDLPVIIDTGNKRI